MANFKSRRDKLRKVHNTFPKVKEPAPSKQDFPISVPKRAVKGRKGKWANSVSSAANVNLFSSGARTTLFYDSVSVAPYVRVKRYKAFSSR